MEENQQESSTAGLINNGSQHSSANLNVEEEAKQIRQKDSDMTSGETKKYLHKDNSTKAGALNDTFLPIMKSEVSDHVSQNSMHDEEAMVMESANKSGNKHYQPNAEPREPIMADVLIKKPSTEAVKQMRQSKSPLEHVRTSQESQRVRTHKNKIQPAVIASNSVAREDHRRDDTGIGTNTHSKNTSQLKSTTPQPTKLALDSVEQSDSNMLSPLSSATVTKKRKKVASQTLQVEYEQSMMDMSRHNKMKREELGGLNLDDIKKIGDHSLQKMIGQSKMLNVLSKFQKHNNEEIEQLSDGELDDPFDMEDFHPGTKNQDGNKNVFRRNYGIETQLPGYYIQNAKIWPKDMRYVIRIIKYVCPQESVYKCQNFTIDQIPAIDETEQKLLVGGEILTSKDMFTQHGYNLEKLEQKYYQPNSCVIQLLKSNQDFLEVVEEVVIEEDSKFEIEFSLRGDFLCLFAKQTHVLKIFKVDDNLQDVIHNINDKDFIFKQYKDIPELCHCKKIYFGREEKLVAAYGDYEVLLFKLSDDSKTFYRYYEIDQDTFEGILDLQLTSYDDKVKAQFRCEVACKYVTKSVVQIWDLQTLKKRSSKDITQPPKYKMHPGKQIFFNKVKDKKLKVKIQDDFGKVVLACGKDSYELRMKSEDEYIQKVMQLSENNDKTLNQMLSHKKQLYYLVNCDFDTEFQLKHSENQNFNVSVPHLLTPGLNQQVLDIMVNQDASKLVFVTQTDSNFYYFAIDLKEQKLERALFDKNIQQVSCMWPYVAYVDNKNIIWVVCGYDQYVLKRIVLPYDVTKTRIPKIYITDDFDLFFIVNNFQEDTYDIIQIDLDYPRPFYDFREQQFPIKKIFSYTYEDVEGKPLEDFIMRSSSEKESSNANKRMFAFVLHAKKIYFYCQGNEKLDYVDETNTRRIQNKQISHDSFYYDKKVKNVLTSEEVKIMQIKMRFSTYQKSELYSENAPTGQAILGWTYDHQSDKMIVLYDVEVFSGFVKKILVYDLKTKKRIGVAIMQDPELINRFISRQFTIIGGHMYFDNTVLKVRYDSMINTKSDFIQENHFIDKYTNILDMKRGDKVFAQMPMISMSCHKQVYMISNQTHRQPLKLIVMPYMHERRLYLNKMKDTNKYFYTIFEDDNADYWAEDSEIKRKTNYIVALDLTGHKGFVYSEGGLLYQRFDYGEEFKDFGQPISVSSNGKNFLFQNPRRKRVVYVTQLEMDERKAKDDLYQKNKTFRMSFIKKIDVRDCLAEYVDLYEKFTAGTPEQEEGKKLRVKLIDDYSKFMIEKKNSYVYKINDNRDMVVEISNIIDRELQKQFEVMFPEVDRAIVLEICRLRSKQAALAATAPVRKTIINLKKVEKENFKNKIHFLEQTLTEESQELLGKKKIDKQEQLNLYNAMQSMQGSIIYLQKEDYESPNAHNVSEQQQSDTDGASSLWIRDKKLEIPAADAGTLKFEVSNKSLAKSQRQSLEAKLDSLKLIFTKEHELFRDNYISGNFTLGSRRLYFWNFYQAWIMTFNEEANAVNQSILGSMAQSQIVKMTGKIIKPKEQEQQFKTLSLHVDKDEKESLIKRISVGSNNPDNKKDYVTIVVRQSKSSDSVIIYDTFHDCEVNNFDTKPNAIISYDAMGNLYIIDGDNIIITEQNLKLNSYQTECVRTTNLRRLGFDLAQGHHFDYVNHNFMLMNEYIGLSFSFMNLVIRDKHQNLGDEGQAQDYQLDLEQFNYNINMKTFMTCDNFVTKDYEKLEQALKLLHERNPALLEQLHYYFIEEIECDNDENTKENIQDIYGITNFKEGGGPNGLGSFVIKQSPLRLAKNNSKSANIILNYMSRIPTNASKTFCDILPLFVESSMFLKYLNELPFQSLEMSQKGTLAIHEAYSDRIVSITDAPMSYVDEAFYKTILKEDKSNVSNINYVIKMTALQVDWIIQQQEGKLFLDSLVEADNEEIFESDTVIAIIEYLYINFKKSVIRQQFPIYLVQLACFFISIKINVETKEWYHWVPNVMDYFNLVFATYTLTLIYQTLYHSSSTVFLRPWIYCDITYMVLMYIISFNRIYESFNHGAGEIGTGLYNIRIMQSFLSLTILGRLLYFMQIIDQIAPLIRIIILIFADIKWFFVIYIITVFAFSCTFELLGRNLVEHVQLRGLDGDDWSPPEFASTIGAFTHVYRIGLGDFDFDGYDDMLEEGDENDTSLPFFLYFFWYIAGFLLQIHLLNMLIAIMGETFSKNNETKHISFIKSHLQFVLDNWWKDPLTDKQRINYLITAFTKDDEDDGSEVLQELIKNQDQVEELIGDKFQDLNDLITANHMSLNHMIQDLKVEINKVKENQKQQ